MTQLAIWSVARYDLLVSTVTACACMMTVTGECALRDSGKSFTIVRPGHLVNEAAGQHKLITGQLLSTSCSTAVGSTVMKSAAMLCVH